MARQAVTTITYLDDLDHEPIPEDQVQVVKFSWEGSDYTIDLRPENAEKFQSAMKKWVEASTRETKTRARSATTRAASGTKRSTEELKEIRDWAAANGLEVSTRGRIAQTVIDQYLAAN